MAADARLLAEALAIIWQLMRQIPDAALRREYRHRLWQAAKRRLEPNVLQIYALKCALHFHAFMMARDMMSQVVAADGVGQPSAVAEPLALSA